jgi:hypothetical protein
VVPLLLRMATTRIPQILRDPKENDNKPVHMPQNAPTPNQKAV